jgi:hypothetical protein
MLPRRESATYKHLHLFSSDEYCLRGLRRISRKCCSAVPVGEVCFIGLILVLITVPESRKLFGRQTAQAVLCALTAGTRYTEPFASSRFKASSLS